MGSYQKSLAFNLGLVAVKAPKKDDHVLLRVEGWGSTATKSTKRIIDDATPTVAELDMRVNTVDYELALWVGLRLRASEYLKNERPKRPDAGGTELIANSEAVKVPKGLSVDALGSNMKRLPVWQDESGAANIVVKFGPQNDRLMYYELRNRDLKSGVRVVS